MNLKQHKKELMKDSEFKKEWERFDLWFEIGMWWKELRCKINKFLKDNK